MNRSAAISELTIRGYVGKFRPVWASEFRVVVDNNGNTEFFGTAYEAECIAWRVLYALEQPIMVRSGEILSATRREAEELFRKKGEAA